ncbi:MAG TPA: DUF1003 domain-containing protein [Stellaceae bacterium]|jgi:uncharacterized membrane protein|nr:DUF1003 domain-containing protein [Stellaceae bacterium]
MPATNTPRRRRTRTADRACRVCERHRPDSELIPAALVRPNIGEVIHAACPAWDATGYICRPCLNRFRGEFVRAEMERDIGALTGLEEEVMHSLHDGALVTDNTNREFESSLTFGERIADKVAVFGGSWRFIILFFAGMTAWIIINSLLMLKAPFDPYPYILLNLALSMLAAVQAPVILMSQNRQEDRDRLRAENDYQVNLKAELEIRGINEKLDQLIHQQWAHLLEIQQIQMEMIDDLAARKGK